MKERNWVHKAESNGDGKLMRLSGVPRSPYECKNYLIINGALNFIAQYPLGTIERMACLFMKTSNDHLLHIGHHRLDQYLVAAQVLIFRVQELFIVPLVDGGYSEHFRHTLRYDW